MEQGEYIPTKIKRRGQNIDSITLVSDKQKRTYRFYNTQEAAVLGFKLGEVDMLEEIVDPQFLTNWKNVVISPQISSNRYVAVFFNTQDPLLADKNLRQALTYAIPQ